LSADYQLYRIPGSLNIPLSFIKTKGFLADKSVVLINNGFKRKPLNNEIDRLKLIGFSDVLILAGGMTGWRRADGRVEGNFEAAQQSNLVTPVNGASLSYFQPKNQLKISAIFSIFTHEKHAKNIANAPGISPAGQASKTSLDSAEICREDGSAEAEILQANRRTL
jgi:hypothetical protein